MKKVLFSILFILGVNSVSSQETVILIHKFYNSDNSPYKEDFISYNISAGATQNDLQALYDYYETNKAEVISSFEEVLFYNIWKEREEIKRQKNERLAIGLNIAANALVQGIETYNQRKEIERQEQEAQKAQLRAEQQARVAQNKQKYAEFQAMTNRKVYSSDYQSSASGYSSQGNYDNMLTSDLNRNMAIQQSVQQYGVNGTRDAINQANAYDVQAKSTGGYGGQIISAVTSDRKVIKIQVRNRKIGGKIVAYSLGANFEGQQQWQNTDGIISKCSTNLEYQYTAYLQGVGNIYFDM